MARCFIFFWSYSSFGSIFHLSDLVKTFLRDLEPFLQYPTVSQLIREIWLKFSFKNFL